MTLEAKGYGKDLRMMRADSGLSQKELADLIKVSTSTVSKIEIGMQRPSLDQLFMWAGFCGFTAKVFFSRKEKQGGDK